MGTFQKESDPTVLISPSPGLLPGDRWVGQPVSCEQGPGPSEPGHGWELLLGGPCHQQEQGECHPAEEATGLPGDGRWGQEILPHLPPRPLSNSALGWAWGWPWSPVPRIPVSPSGR